MLWAPFSDLMQRIITLNKWEQKINLRRRVQTLNLPQGSKVLDFGCGTGLYARVFTKMGFHYCGYDIDHRLVSYAHCLYRNCQFTASKDELKKEAPFDLVVANCCFHHIDDLTLHEELNELKRILSADGTLFVVDILISNEDTFLLRKLFRKLELGGHVRSYNDYKKLIEQHFKIVKSNVGRSHLFSIKNNPIYNDMVFFECTVAHVGGGG